MASRADITLYTAGTPNGWKANVICEELGVNYDVYKINISENTQKEDWYLKINPNGRIPAIVDHSNGDLPVFESAAIMLYLCEKEKSALVPTDISKKAEVLSWVMFQMGGIGPMFGQANHFMFKDEKIPYGQKRYIEESKRLLSVVESSLEGKEYLALGQYTVADIANFCWIICSPFFGVDWADYPNIKAWVERIKDRPAIKKGITEVPAANERALGMLYDDAKRKETVAEQKGKWAFEG